MKFATWDEILRIVEASGPSGTSNRQINVALGEVDSHYEFCRRENDVSHLTRLMAKAGDISMAPRAQSSLANIYYPAPRQR